MIALTGRNLLLFARDRMGMLLSLTGALVAFVLYVVFLRRSMSGEWALATAGKTSAGNALLDTWLMGGMLAITGTTTPLGAMGQLVDDRENGRDVDFRVARVGPLRIAGGYILSCALIGLLMQAVVLVVTGLWFRLADDVTLPWAEPRTIALLPPLMVLNSACGTALAYALTSLMPTHTANSSLNTIVGTAAGFLAGVYIPVGVMPDAAQGVVTLWPGAYAASLFRRLLMSRSIPDVFGESASGADAFRRQMGLGYEAFGLGATTAVAEVALLLTTTAGIIAITMLVRRMTRMGRRRMRRIQSAATPASTTRATTRTEGEPLR
ncbi:ABC transporter permease [uncultured Bifidobacterium sp.]|uniref:ABC transporter permease n=1 Tax=uncultured Bifidobacterium sp. TaxID=165187 RepID=UPI0028DB808D|nr:ABC transporter permease [uncultured Bifidobacterium sp.]